MALKSLIGRSWNLRKNNLSLKAWKKDMIWLMLPISNKRKFKYLPLESLILPEENCFGSDHFIAPLQERLDLPENSLSDLGLVVNLSNFCSIISQKRKASNQQETNTQKIARSRWNFGLYLTRFTLVFCSQFVWMTSFFYMALRKLNWRIFENYEIKKKACKTFWERSDKLKGYSRERIK